MSKIDYAKRAEELEERCKTVPELPEDFESWCKGLFKESWLYYKREKNHAQMFCCNCGSNYRIRTKAREGYEGSFEKVYPIPVHNELGRCIICDKPVIYKAGFTRGDTYGDSKVVLIGQKYQERGYVLREFEINRCFGKNQADAYSFRETLRSWYLPGARQVQEDWNKWDWYQKKEYWDYSGYGGYFKQQDHFGHIYPMTYANMRGTVMEYSQVKEYIQKTQRHPHTYKSIYQYELRGYLNTYFRYPVMEALVKMGAYKMVQRMEYSWRTNMYHINNRAKNPYDMLRIRKNRLKQVVETESSAFLRWCQWEAKNCAIDDETMQWLMKLPTYGEYDPKGMECLLKHMSPRQIMNYVSRQQAESYAGRSAEYVIGQYIDYYKMCEKEHKNMDDEMVYRPRELKRRHDEVVAEIQMRAAQAKADEYSKKYKEAEKVLGKIKKKFEYAGSSFFIKVPEKIVDIVMEGNALHHCVAASGRYFDRIKQNETYICFLRKTAEPEIPFYTVEVEPGGTIRQHRGMFDEEPEIEQVKPFLIEWQAEIKKRMSDDDHKLAAASKQKREANIEELKAKNNTRVLEGLAEDLMEAM